jgi:hypothetical protein
VEGGETSHHPKQLDNFNEDLIHQTVQNYALAEGKRPTVLHFKKQPCKKLQRTLLGD